MTHKVWRYGLVALAAIVAVTIYQMDRDTRRINKRLNQLAGTVEKTAGEGHLSTLAKSQQVVGYLTPDAVLRLHPVLPQQVTRRELSTVFYQVHSRVETLDFRIRDRRLEVDRPAGTANMRFTAIGTARWGARNESQIHEFHLRWVKQDREWYIDQAEIVQAIRPPRR